MADMNLCNVKEWRKSIYKWAQLYVEIFLHEPPFHNCNVQSQKPLYLRLAQSQPQFTVLRKCWLAYWYASLNDVEPRYNNQHNKENCRAFHSQNLVYHYMTKTHLIQLAISTEMEGTQCATRRAM
uniref:Uncharacterized protein n=1 Tax=Rhipicephalus zambeziensis TaxID=60191 RepID=A0A224YHT1_9ACAR